MERTYAIVIEDAGGNYSAFAPDVSGCAATGATVEETIAQMREALEFHFEGMEAHGETIPEPRAHVATIAVRLPTTPVASDELAAAVAAASPRTAPTPLEDKEHQP